MGSIGHRSCNSKMKKQMTPLCAFKCIMKGFSWSLLLFEWEINSFSIQPLLTWYRVMGERSIVYDIVSNGSLWSNVVFEKEAIFHEFDFETSDLEFEVSKSSIWKNTTWCDKGVFSFIIISQLRRPIELKFSQVCYFMHMLRYTNCED